MGADYRLQIETSLTPRQVFEIPAKVANTEIRTHIMEDREDYTLRVPSVWAIAVGTEIYDDIWRTLVIEAYNFVPTVDITFEYYTREEPEQWEQLISQSFASILKDVKGKAYALYNLSDTIVERLDERCLLTNDPQYDWLAKGFDEVGMKYERRQLESPLL